MIESFFFYGGIGIVGAFAILLLPILIIILAHTISLIRELTAFSFESLLEIYSDAFKKLYSSIRD